MINHGLYLLTLNLTQSMKFKNINYLNPIKVIPFKNPCQ